VTLGAEVEEATEAPIHRHDGSATQEERGAGHVRAARFVSHSEASRSLEVESAPRVVQTWGWSDNVSRSEALRLNRRTRVQRRAQRLLHEYTVLQTEATAAALIHAQRATQGRVQCTTAMD
jgi:hypothetical protein